MGNQHRKTPVRFSEFLFHLVPPPATEDYPTNQAIARDAASFLRQVFQAKDGWENPLRRRMVADCVQLFALGEPGAILRDFGTVYWRDGRFEVFFQPIPCLTGDERRLIEDVVRLARDQLTDDPL